MCWKDVLISLGLGGMEFTPKPPPTEPEEFTPKPPPTEPEEFAEESDILQSLGDAIAFEMRLAETIEWCLRRADILEPKDSLRSEALKPKILFNEDSYLYNPAKRIEGISDLLAKRSKLLGKEVVPVNTNADLKEGKLLAFFPDETFCDGAAEMASYGFFDVDNVPAWDTWVGIFQDYDREYIVSYIPHQFVPLVDEGTYVNPEDCIPWLERSDTKLARKLLQKGIIHKDNFRFRL